MKNLKPYPDNSFDFYQSVVDQKESAELVLRLKNINGKVDTSFMLYDDHYGTNTLEQIMEDGGYAGHKKDLLDLYSYQFSIIKKLRLAIQKEQPRETRYTCQHCTLTSNESMDHFLPKEDFPVYSVHPLNLLPCCTKCNQFKWSNWRKGGKRIALNLYLDKLPDIQYLFLNVFTDADGDIDFKYTVENPNGIDKNLFELIKGHYKQLDLLNRMREKSIPLITEYKNMIENRVKNVQLADIINEFIDTAEANKIDFGANYWKSILEIGLVNSADFIDLIDK